MWNLKKGQTELLCRTDADSQTLKNLWSPEETVWGWGDVLGLWDGNPVTLDCDDHYTTTDVTNSWGNKKKKNKKSRKNDLYGFRNAFPFAKCFYNCHLP